MYSAKHAARVPCTDETSGVSVPCLPFFRTVSGDFLISFVKCYFSLLFFFFFFLLQTVFVQTYAFLWRFCKLNFGHIIPVLPAEILRTFLFTDSWLALGYMFVKTKTMHMLALFAVQVRCNVNLCCLKTKKQPKEKRVKPNQKKKVISTTNRTPTDFILTKLPKRECCWRRTELQVRLFTI